MYVYYFAHFVGEPPMWANRLDGDGARLRELARIALRGVLSETPGVDDRVTFGPSRNLGRGFWIPVTWSAPGLFTRLSGDLSIQPIGLGATQISFRASYATDNTGDPTEVHRRVEAVVKGFLDSVEPVGQPGTQPRHGQ